MSYRKVSGLAAAVGMALALTTGASADPGNSPNGAPGPEGNPNPPSAVPQANGPQGPAGNDQRGNSQTNANHGARGQGEANRNARANEKSKSNSKPAPKPKSKSKSNHANPNPGTPRKGGREDRPSPKVTICHATRSETNPYVEITISENGLNGHGPAADPRHHEGSWPDIIPAPAAGCPTTPQQSRGAVRKRRTTGAPTTDPVTPTQGEVRQGLLAPAGSQAVLGASAQGTSPASASADPKNVVLGASAEGETPAADAPATALAARDLDEDGSLPFTGFELAFLLVLAATALLGGIALRRATRATDV